MDAFVDIDIAELELLMEQQGMSPEAATYGGDPTFTPELFLSHGSTDAYTSNFDAFEEAWLETVLAPEADGDDAISDDKPTTLFTEGDEEPEPEDQPGLIDDNGPGGANYEVIVNGVTTRNSGGDTNTAINNFSGDGIDQNGPGGAYYEVFVTGSQNPQPTGDGDEPNLWSFDAFWNTPGVSSLPLSGTDMAVLTLPEGAQLYDGNGDPVQLIEQADGTTAYIGEDSSGASGVADDIEGGRIVLSDGTAIVIPWYACC